MCMINMILNYNMIFNNSNIIFFFSNFMPLEWNKIANASAYDHVNIN